MGKISRKEEKLIIDMYLNWKPVTEIAESVGRSKSSVFNILNKNSIPRRKKTEIKENLKTFGKKNVKEIPSKKIILERFLYYPDKGRLINKKTNKWDIKLDEKGYRIICFRSKGFQFRFKEHRVIFFLETGRQPEELDHIDGNRSNNHISNLREATFKQNSSNKKSKSESLSPYKGVSFDKRCPQNPWRAYSGGKFLGQFPTEEDAAIAYNKYILKKDPEFGFINKIKDNE